MTTLNQASNVPLRIALDPRTLWRDLWRHRGLIGQMAVREFNQRYRATSLGVLWAVAQPLMMLAVYTFVFGVVFQAKFGNQPQESQVDFALAIYAGLTVYNLFSLSVSQAVASIVSQPNYVKKVVFPLQAFPVAISISTLFLTAINVALLCLFALVFRHALPVTALCLPLILLPTLLLSLGLGFFLASLGVYLRDVEHAVTLVLQVLFFLTPIFYEVERAGSLAIVVRMNPLSPMVESARAALLWGEWPSWGWLFAALVLSVVTLQLGYAWFIKTRGGFADVL